MEKKYVIVVSIVGFAFAAGAAFGIWRFVKINQELRSLKAQTVSPAKELIDIVGKLMVLPTGEMPTIATVDDPSKLKDQPFFASAKKGDRVLLYTQAKKIILYRPDENKIIDVSVVSLGTSSATLTAPVPTSFILWNGTTTVGFTKTYTKKLVSLVSTATVVDTDNAKKNDYPTSVLVDLTGKKPDEVKAIGSTLGIAVASLPDGETKPTGADFLIILGADQK